MTVMRFALTIYALKHYPRPADQTRYVQSEKHAVPSAVAGPRHRAQLPPIAMKRIPYVTTVNVTSVFETRIALAPKFVWQDNATPSTFV